MATATKSSSIEVATREGNSTPIEFERILGVRFFRGTVLQAIDHFLRLGGLLVIPASPALTKLRYSQQYRRALLEADMALLDSGLVASIWKLMTGRSVSKISGTAYLQVLLRNAELCGSAEVLWVVDSDSLVRATQEWLRSNGHDLRRHSFQIHDAEREENHNLLLEIEQGRPAHIIIATAGGTQEKLGLYLREYLLYRPCLHCVGSGLLFLTGHESAVPTWAETVRLGWIFRLIAQPRMILPRTGIAIALSLLLLRNRAEAPSLQPRWADV